MAEPCCKTCGATTSPSGAPVTLVALNGNTPVYSCDQHAAELAAPPGDLSVALAQLADAYRQLYRDWA
ncbi:hypothetical protein [Streptomyces sp. NPDC048659]|uniref:hypothetical protein n=1 Tax=Streptomyces sp. NPDC048659 TaxID=3155489 RepID=UPI0034385E0C